jgi:hypothetical protein
VFIGNPGQASAVILPPTVKPNSGSKTTKTPYIQRPAATQQSRVRIWGRAKVVLTCFDPYWPRLKNAAAEFDFGTGRLNAG